ncbi:Bgt-4649 [Blumeria graminis f. sp. tritici]|uniref:Bgt-4649 n=2 Tax=Blumeria graminis f. sp. tritici TaxID=62690 RepID=A0A381LG19_BLUGR|nr:hypothetical protein BGT96224_4649 [Blumeria graminis f. sp. tritici 96224]VCU40601.1 Bgt-4649 [Blumeria graminis f. sp. tritici]
MAQLRSPSILDPTREPHSVSLKVLRYRHFSTLASKMLTRRRLSRPSLSTQQPLPASLDTTLTSASYAYPASYDQDNAFILSPLLTLPPAFGSAYVGETFSCLLSANNEILPDSPTEKTIRAVRIEAEMKVPGSGDSVKLRSDSDTRGSEIALQEDSDSTPLGINLEPGRSLQKIVNYQLKDEGTHVLAVTINYSETSATSGRLRTFRKLYQFVCKNCLVVRSKASVLPNSLNLQQSWTLEAQLENCGDETITLDAIELQQREGFTHQSLNWDAQIEGHLMDQPRLMPGDVYQVCFCIHTATDAIPEPVDGKLIFGALCLSWSGSMGKRGSLTTDALGIRVN